MQFAKSQCLGSVIVWAVSQDMMTATSASSSQSLSRRGQISGRDVVSLQSFSRQLQAATAFISAGVSFDPNKGQSEGDLDTRVQRNQCRWTGCGEMCGSGYYPVYRTDTDRHSDTEYMLDSTNCKDGGVHTLCCPAYGPYTECGWFGFWNGGCTGECPSGFAQVGSSATACHSGKPQAACCTAGNAVQLGQERGEITSTALYANCHWEGNNRGDWNCPTQEADSCASGERLVASQFGSGGDVCAADRKVLYCCWEQTDVKKWDNCY